MTFLPLVRFKILQTSFNLLPDSFKALSMGFKLKDERYTNVYYYYSNRWHKHTISNRLIIPLTICNNYYNYYMRLAAVPIFINTRLRVWKRRKKFAFAFICLYEQFNTDVSCNVHSNKNRETALGFRRLTRN